MTAAPESDLDYLVSAIPFAATLGIVLEAASAQEVAGRFEWDASRCTVGGVLHGGALMAFADSLGGICAFLNLPPGAGTTTVESKTNFFRAVRSGGVRGVCRPLHVGRSMMVVQTDLFDGEERRVAQVTQTQLVLPPR